LVKVDLITGFLGSGKTTFIREYVKYLTEVAGEKVCILENDYGAINVDTMLLADLKSDKCSIEMVAGGTDYDCHIRRFRTKLITMAMLGFNRVVIEPSGIFDVDEFFDIMHEDTLERFYQIANVLTVVKADLEENLSPEADFLLASQVANAGRVILSHSEEVDQSTVEKCIAHMNRALASVKCKRVFETPEIGSLGKVTCKNLWELSPDDFASIAKSGSAQWSFEKTFSMDDNAFESLFFMHLHLGIDELKEKIQEVFRDTSCGKVMRVKGFLTDDQGKWLEVNATSLGMDVREISEGQEVLIVIGENMQRERIAEYFPAKYSTIKTE